jgi:hypothetical protein
VQQLFVEVVNGGDPILRNWHNVCLWTPDWATVRSAKCKRTSNTNGTKSIQTVCVCESLILDCRLSRIAGTTRFPVVVLDARNHCSNFGLRKATI